MKQVGRDGEERVKSSLIEYIRFKVEICIFGGREFNELL